MADTTTGPIEADALAEYANPLNWEADENGNRHPCKEQDLSESQELTFKRRKNRNGKPSIAPFINGWNVWDIPPSEWTTAVQEAIKHAYELGWRHCNDAHAEIWNCSFQIDARFKEQS